MTRYATVLRRCLPPPPPVSCHCVSAYPGAITAHLTQTQSWLREMCESEVKQASSFEWWCYLQVKTSNGFSVSPYCCSCCFQPKEAYQYMCYTFLTPHLIYTFQIRCYMTYNELARHKPHQTNSSDWILTTSASYNLIGEFPSRGTFHVLHIPQLLLKAADGATNGTKVGGGLSSSRPILSERSVERWQCM